MYSPNDPINTEPQQYSRFSDDHAPRGSGGGGGQYYYSKRVSNDPPTSDHQQHPRMSKAVGIDETPHDVEDGWNIEVRAVKGIGAKKKAAKKASIKKSRHHIWRPHAPGGNCCWKGFPCCFNIPLDVGLQITTFFDIIYGTILLILWTTILGIDIFAPNTKDFGSGKNGSLIMNASASGSASSRNGPSDGVLPYFDPTSTTTTTKKPAWTLRPTTTEPPLFEVDINLIDVDRTSKIYSKIAFWTQQYHSSVEAGCGDKYLKEFLFNNALTWTKRIWEEFLWYAIAGELLYILLGVLTIICVCCFMEHRGTKVLLMIIWYAEWIPILLQFQAIILSQSKRLCILQYALNGLKGQKAILYGILWRVCFFKSYQLTLIFFYLKELLAPGYLVDESFHPQIAPGQETIHAEYAQAYFSDFYEHEDARGGNASGLFARETNVPLRYAHLEEDQVAEAQSIVTGNEDDDPFSMRNVDIRQLQATGQVDHAMKSLRRL